MIFEEIEKNWSKDRHENSLYQAIVLFRGKRTVWWCVKSIFLAFIPFLNLILFL